MKTFIVALFLILAVLAFILTFGGNNQNDKDRAMLIFCVSVAAAVLLLLFWR